MYWRLDELGVTGDVRIIDGDLTDRGADSAANQPS